MASFPEVGLGAAKMGAREMTLFLKFGDASSSGASVIRAEDDDGVISKIVTVDCFENRSKAIVCFHDEVGVGADAAFPLPCFGGDLSLIHI